MQDPVIDIFQFNRFYNTKNILMAIIVIYLNIILILLVITVTLYSMVFNPKEVFNKYIKLFDIQTAKNMK